MCVQSIPHNSLLEIQRCGGWGEGFQLSSFGQRCPEERTAAYSLLEPFARGRWGATAHEWIFLCPSRWRQAGRLPPHISLPHLEGSHPRTGLLASGSRPLSVVPVLGPNPDWEAGEGGRLSFSPRLTQWRPHKAACSVESREEDDLSGASPPPHLIRLTWEKREEYPPHTHTYTQRHRREGKPSSAWGWGGGALNRKGFSATLE